MIRFEEASGILKLVKEATHINEITCTRYSTKRNGYSPFHIDVSGEDYEMAF